MKNTEVTKLAKAMLIEGDNFFVSSRVVAEKFGKEHRHILRSVYHILQEDKDSEDTFNETNFIASTFRDTKGREYPEFLMTRDGFSLLSMGFTGKEARNWKINFIKAFNHMEATLLKQSRRKRDSDYKVWKEGRDAGKIARNELTGTIKDFIEYAKNQGSKNADWYYKHYSSMTYKALTMTDHETHSNIHTNSFRDSLEKMELSYLMFAESMAQNWIVIGMQNEMHYKDIFALVKEKVNIYAQSVYLPLKNANHPKLFVPLSDSTSNISAANESPKKLLKKVSK